MNLTQFISDEIVSCTFMEHSDIRVVSTSLLTAELVLFKHKNTPMSRFVNAVEKIESFLQKDYSLEKNLLATDWNLTYSSHVLRITLKRKTNE